MAAQGAAMQERLIKPSFSVFCRSASAKLAGHQLELDIRKLVRRCVAGGIVSTYRCRKLKLRDVMLDHGELVQSEELSCMPKARASGPRERSVERARLERRECRQTGCSSTWA